MLSMNLNREVGNVAMNDLCILSSPTTVAHPPRSACSSYQSAFRCERNRHSLGEMMGTSLCAFRKNLPRSIAPLNVIKVLINIHVQHLYSKHLITALKKKGMGEGEREKLLLPSVLTQRVPGNKIYGFVHKCSGN